MEANFEVGWAAEIGISQGVGIFAQQRLDLPILAAIEQVVEEGTKDLYAGTRLAKGHPVQAAQLINIRQPALETMHRVHQRD